MMADLDPCQKCGAPEGELHDMVRHMESPVKRKRTWPHVEEMPSGAGTDPRMANEIAYIVADLFGGYAPFSVRYGVAHALLDAGYVKHTTETYAAHLVALAARAGHTLVLDHTLLEWDEDFQEWFVGNDIALIWLHYRVDGSTRRI